MNVIGEPVDEMGPIGNEKEYAIHREAPSSRTSPQGRGIHHRIKVVDPGALMPAAAKSACSAALASQDRSDYGTDQQHCQAARRFLRLRRRRRAYPRRERPLDGDEGIGVLDKAALVYGK